jgi:hypothetical protein
MSNGRSRFTRFLFALTWLEHLHHFSNLCDNFQFNAIWHRRSMAALIFCRRLAESDVTVAPSVMCMDWLHWWYNHVACLVSSSTALSFLINVSEKHKSTSPYAIQVKNPRKAIGIKEKLHIISQLEKKVNKLLIYAVRLDSLIVAYIQFVIMLTELKEVLSQELKCLFV